MVTPRSVWLGTVGLGQEFGGVAHVARCSVRALSQPEGAFRLDRIVSLLDTPQSIGPAYVAQRCPIKRCQGNRLRFSGGILSQSLSRPDMILFDHVDIAQCQTLLPRRLRSPYAVWVHGIEVWKELPKRKLDALRGADLLIFNSDFTKRRFESFHGSRFPTRIVHLTAGSVDAQDNHQRRKPWILTVGRMEHDRPKGHQQILDAMPEIARAVPDVQWHIVGKGRALEPFREQVAARAERNQIHLHGFLDAEQLQSLFRDCRVFAMPSFGEGFGIVYLEAMQHGCLPVGSTLDAAPEVIGDGGVCLDPTEGASVQRELIRLLTEPDDVFLHRSQQARARAATFSEEQFQANLIDALAEVGKGQKTR